MSETDQIGIIARDINRIANYRAEESYLNGYEAATALMFQIVNMAETLEGAKSALAFQLKGTQRILQSKSFTADAPGIESQIKENTEMS